MQHARAAATARIRFIDTPKNQRMNFIKFPRPPTGDPSKAWEGVGKSLFYENCLSIFTAISEPIRNTGTFCFSSLTQFDVTADRLGIVRFIVEA